MSLIKNWDLENQQLSDANPSSFNGNLMDKKLLLGFFASCYELATEAGVGLFVKPQIIHWEFLHQ